MISRTTPQFWKSYRRLTEPIRHQARAAYRLFAEDPYHPGLHFKRVHSVLPVYSVRINRECRALGVMEEPLIIWFWIGSHDEYERLIRRL